MFKRKSIIAAVAAALIAALCLVCFAACDINGDGSVKNITVYVGEKSFGISTTETNLHGVLSQLYKEDKITAYETSDSGYGAFITRIDVLVQSNRDFYTVWHNLDKLEYKCVYNEDTAQWNPARSESRAEEAGVFVVTTYNNTLLYYSGVVISSLPIADGGVYAVLVG